MKNFLNLFVLLLGLILPTLSFSQTNVKEDLRNMRNGQSIQLVAKNGANNLSTLNLSKSNDQFNLNFDFPGMPGVTQAKIEYYKNGSKVYQNLTSHGPNAGFEIPVGKLVHTQTVVKSKDDIWWPLIVLAALCCIEASVGSDGWSVGFDCDCLSIDLSPIVVGGGSNGQDIQVDEIKIIPITNNIGDTLLGSTIFVNR